MIKPSAQIDRLAHSTERDWLRVVTGFDHCQRFEDMHGGQPTLIEAIVDGHVLVVDQELSNTLGWVST